MQIIILILTPASLWRSGLWRPARCSGRPGPCTSTPWYLQQMVAFTTMRTCGVKLVGGFLRGICLHNIVSSRSVENFFPHFTRAHYVLRAIEEEMIKVTGIRICILFGSGFTKVWVRVRIYSLPRNPNPKYLKSRQYREILIPFSIVIATDNFYILAKFTIIAFIYRCYVDKYMVS